MPNPDLAPDLAPSPASPRPAKRAVILDAARAVFLANGYVGSSMDLVAATAGVSKQTVYKHFGDKERLFFELVASTVRHRADAVGTDVAPIARIAPGEDLGVALGRLARRMVRRIMHPELVQLRRLVIGEAARFPHLGEIFYNEGLGRAIDLLAEVLQQLAEQGVLAIDDPHLAAEHFNWLVVSIPLNRAMILGTDEPFTPEELDHFADAGVAVFIAAHTPT